MKIRNKQIKSLLIILLALIISYFYPSNLNQTNKKILVSRVIDGDTIELNTGEKLRYIGIDTPEISFGKNPECYAIKAKEFNQKLVDKKEVKIEKDISDKDKYGRLLRYVYFNNESTSSAIFINEYLVRQGYAIVSTYPPDVKYIEDLLLAQKDARENNRGLWKDCY